MTLEYLKSLEQEIVDRVLDAFNRGRLAGAAEQLKRCEEAIEKRLEYYDAGSLGNKIIKGDIAAIHAAAINEE